MHQAHYSIWSETWRGMKATQSSLFEFQVQLLSVCD